MTRINLRKRPVLSYWLLFTFTFILLAAFMLFIFRRNGRLMIWKPDGVYQYSVALLYVKQYIAGLFATLTGQAPVSTPLFNFTIGQGTDILQSGWGQFTDPICWLSLILQWNNLENAYELMALLKLFCAGVAFSLFCFVSEKKQCLLILAGSITYIFFGFVLFLFRHPVLTGGLYTLPLLLAGFELLIRKNKHWLLIWSTFFGLATSFYTFYMAFLVAVVYAVIRLFPRSLSELRQNYRLILLTCVDGIVGFCLASCFMLPIIDSFINSSRNGVTTGYTTSLLLYPGWFYRQIMYRLCIPAFSNGFWTIMGLVPVSFFALASVMTTWSKRKLRLQAFFLVMTALLCTPFGGLVMNGFGYVTNRWMFAWGMVASMALICEGDGLGAMSFRSETVLSTVVCVYLAINMFAPEIKTKTEFIALTFVALSFISVLYVNRANLTINSRHFTFLVLAVLGATINIYLQFDSHAANGAREYAQHNEVFARLGNFEKRTLHNVADDISFYRVERYEHDSNRINIGYQGIRSSTVFGAFIHQSASSFYSTLQLNSYARNNMFHGFDDRTALSALGAVKYYIARSSDIKYVPYGFKNVSDNLYMNQYNLPLGFISYHCIPESQFISLSPLEKQQAMLQGIVLGSQINTMTTFTPAKRIQEIKYIIKNTNNVSLKNRLIDVHKAQGSITLAFTPVPDTEIYLWLDGMIRHRYGASRDVISITSGKQTNDGKIAVSTVKNIQLSNSDYAWHLPKDGVTVNLGYDPDGAKNTVIITFAEKGRYSYNSIQLCANPISDYVKDVEVLRSNVLKNIIVGDDIVTGTVELEKTGVLFLSIPYSTGWSAFVDGKPVELLRANIMYMGIVLQPGPHSIGLRYFTPWLRVGLIMSVSTLICLCIIFVLKLKWFSHSSE